MTWYTTGLKNKTGKFDEMTIQSEYQDSYSHLCEIAKRGCGRIISDETVEKLKRMVARGELDVIEDAGVIQLYPPGNYYYEYGSYDRIATVEEILNVGPIEFVYDNPYDNNERMIKTHFDTLGDLLKDWHGERKNLPKSKYAECYSIYLQGELYNYKSTRLEELLEDLEIIDLPVPISKKPSSKTPAKKTAATVRKKTSAPKKPSSKTPVKKTPVKKTTVKAKTSTKKKTSAPKKALPKRDSKGRFVKKK